MADPDAAPDAAEQLIARLDHLERVLQANTRRLHAIEQHLRLDSAPPPQARAEQRRPLYESIVDEREEAAPPHVEAPSPGPPPETETPLHAPHTEAARDGAGGAREDGRGAGPDAHTGDARAASAATTERPGATPTRRDLESVIGGSWFNWIGIIAVTFGVAFFLKYAFESEWIGPAGRVMLGAAAGLGILFFADRLRARGLRQYAYVLSGGGVLILYLSVYAAFDFYQLIGQPVAFVLMAAVTATAVWLSVRHNALAIALLGLVGGFLTPLLLSTGKDNQVGLFVYVALLDAGVLALAYFKRWRSLDLMSFVGTVLMFFGWLVIHYRQEKLWLTLLFLTLFFLMFSALAVAHNLLPRRLSRWHDILLVIANATFYFGLSYVLLDGAGYDRALGSFALLVSAFFVLLFYAAWTRHRADRLLVYSYVGAAVTFFTMAVAIQTDQHWVTIAWAVEGLMLTWVGLRAGESAPRYAALPVFAVAMAHWFAWDMLDFAFREGGAQFVPLLNRRALSCAALVGALLGAAWLYRREGARQVDADERTIIVTLCQLTSLLLVFILLTLDVSDYFGERLSRVATDDWFYRRRVENARQFSLTVLWSCYGAAALALGLARRVGALRAAALLLLAATAAKVVAFDLGYYDAPWRVPFMNLTFASFAVLVGALWFVYRSYRRSPEVFGEELKIIPVVTVAAHALAVTALSAEAAGYFASRKGATAAGDAGVLRDLRLAEQLALSVVWALYGGGMLLYGYLRSNRLLRLMGLVLLSLTTLKVFFFDLSSLDRIYRIISFVVLGAILLAVSYLYQKTLRRTDDDERAADEKDVVAEEVK